MYDGNDVGGICEGCDLALDPKYIGYGSTQLYGYDELNSDGCGLAFESNCGLVHQACTTIAKGANARNVFTQYTYAHT